MKGMIKWFGFALCLLLCLPSIVVYGQVSIEDVYHNKTETMEQEIQNSQLSELDLETFLEEVKLAHQSLNEISYDVMVEIFLEEGNQTYTSELTATANLAYDNNYSISQATMDIEMSDSESDTQSSQLLLVPGQDKMIYSRPSSEESWQAIIEKGTIDTYSLYPEYYQLVYKTYAFVDDGELYETDESYMLFVSDSQLSLFEIFQADFELSFTGLDVNDLEEKALYIFDKETLIMTDFQLSLYHSLPQGALIDIDFQTYDINNVDWQVLEQGLSEL